MFIELLDLKNLFAPAERNAKFDLLVYQYSAVRWSAKTVERKFYKHLAPLEPEAFQWQAEESPVVGWPGGVFSPERLVL